MHGVVFALSVIPTIPWTELGGLPLFLYFSPDSILPVASILASIIGVALMFGRHFVTLIRKALRRASVPDNQGSSEIADIDLSLEGQAGPRSEEASR